MEERGGWIKIYRQLEDSPIWGNPKLVYFWIWCLMQASISKREVTFNGQNILIKPGQFIFGRKSAASKTGLGEATVRRYLILLEKLKMLNRQTTTRYTLVSIVNWRKFQGDIEKAPAKRPADDTINDTQHKKYIGGAKSSPPDGVELRSPDVDELPVDADGNFIWGDEE